MPTSFITDYEKRAVSYIESQLNDSKVKLWADAFSTDNTVKTRNQIFFGHQKTERQDYIFNTETNRFVYMKIYTLEIRIELFTLKNHQEALNLIEFILDNILNSFRPYYEFTPFVPGESGDATRNKENGSWVYSAMGTTGIMSDIVILTPSFPNFPEGRIIQIGFENAISPDVLDVIGGFRK